MCPYGGHVLIEVNTWTDFYFFLHLVQADESSSSTDDIDSENTVSAACQPRTSWIWQSLWPNQAGRMEIPSECFIDVFFAAGMLGMLDILLLLSTLLFPGRVQMHRVSRDFLLTVSNSWLCSARTFRGVCQAKLRLFTFLHNDRCLLLAGSFKSRISAAGRSPGKKIHRSAGAAAACRLTACQQGAALLSQLWYDFVSCCFYTCRLCDDCVLFGKNINTRIMHTHVYITTLNFRSTLESFVMQNDGGLCVCYSQIYQKPIVCVMLNVNFKILNLILVSVLLLDDKSYEKWLFTLMPVCEDMPLL